MRSTKLWLKLNNDERLKRRSGKALRFLSFISKIPISVWYIRTPGSIYLAPFDGANKGCVISGEGQITFHLRVSGKTSSRHVAFELDLWWERICYTVVDRKEGYPGVVIPLEGYAEVTVWSGLWWTVWSQIMEFLKWSANGHGLYFVRNN